MSMDIYYFSGTGNSLHVAREMQQRIPETNLIPIMRMLHLGAIKTGADMVGFIFPNFCLTIPIPVYEFLHRADLTSAKYIFAICTRGGSQTEAFEYMDEILERQGKTLDARLDINMPWNHCLGQENLPGINNAERIAHLEAQMQSQLDDFCRFVHAQEPYLQKAAGDYKLSAGMRLFDLLVPKSMNYKMHEYMYRNLVQFGADSKCNGCGICAKICLNHKIALVDKKPVWAADVPCYACFACINYCPRKAIQVQSRFPIRSYSEVNDRYHHKSVTYEDIAGQR
jgi:NAD-dependent dihydropyrimidine dehydrogenase PreA subunit